MDEFPRKTRIALGADHAGFQVKESIKTYLESNGYAVDDLGTWSEESVDYPDFAQKVASQVAEGRSRFGILTCGTGIGMSIAANKIEGVRAALAHDATTARLAREHNDANVLAVGARVLESEKAIEVVKHFLAAQFTGGRHQQRIDKITQLDQEREPKA
jgi:ribose 5-phosphate isomerase B